ncbi:MAG TPA: pyridoxal phosphate-dependent aminotransferase [Labilithrix sp.]|nr:pyridoxal phosphate-dependent aminotransferase [Labilithrix sp.]
MTFDEFVQWKARIRRERPEVLDLSETRVAVALRDIRPTVERPEGVANVHRCDLARAWCDVRGLPAAFARRTLTSDGVRHALSLVLGVLAGRGARVAMPRDVYPVYWQLAREAGATCIPIDLLPTFDVERALATASAAKIDVALLPSPLKLHGRAWTAAEVDAAISWLRRGHERRLILDGVYSFGAPLTAATRRLIDTDQVLYLDSLSKGWLHERVFGAAVVPEADLALYADTFRAQAPDQARLYVAQQLLSTQRDFPAALPAAFERGRVRLLRVAAEHGIRLHMGPSGYLAFIAIDSRALLDDHGLLTIPVSAFGSEREGAVVSALLSGPSP